MDQPDVGDACAFPATSSHASAVPAISFHCLVFREANCKPVILKAALFLCYLWPLNAQAWTTSYPSAAGNAQLLNWAAAHSSPHRKSPAPLFTACAPIHPAIAMLVFAVAIALAIPRIFLSDARRTNDIALSIPTLSLSPGTSLRN
ncbi:hypothetical protein K438DRAFT_1850674 [Mycena galopus ATCC 62051]|nr:hypothetical protein K438DRAFT_1850674 [Mycena galopus ATCC 62051]